MMRITLTDGTELDLVTGQEIEIEYENPMLDTDIIPAPYSTDIAFPLTRINLAAFGFIPGAMLEPSVKKASAVIWVSGIPIMYGTLEYTSYEDGALQYTFSGRDLDNDLSEGIYNGSIYEFTDESQIKSTLITPALAGEIDGVGLPAIMNSDATGDMPYEAVDDSIYSEVLSMEGLETKYYNHPIVQSGAGFMPVVLVNKILEGVSGIWSSEPDFGSIAIIGRYEISQYHVRTVTSTGLVFYAGETRDIADTLPDISFADLLRGLGHMLCAAVYPDGKMFRFVRFADIIAEAADAEDWDSKVSDAYNLDREEAQEYVFGYDDEESSDDYDTSDLEDDITDGEISETDTLAATVESLSEDDYETRLLSKTGDIYSVKYSSVSATSKSTSSKETNTAEAVLIDIIYHNTPEQTVEPSEEDDPSTFDNSCDFRLVRCVPDIIHTGTTTSEIVLSGTGKYLPTDPAYRVIPVITPQTSGDDRAETVYVGLLLDGQMTDSGLRFDEDGADADVVDRDSEPDEDGLYPLKDESVFGLTPAELFLRFHQDFAEWISSERQVVSVDLKLTPSDLAAFRMYKTYYFRGRRWLPKKLSITLTAGSPYIATTGEFIAYEGAAGSQRRTLTISPTPSTATVTIGGIARSIARLSEGKKVKWTVSAEGYVPQGGTYTMGDEDAVLEVELEEAPTYYRLQIINTAEEGTVELEFSGDAIAKDGYWLVEEGTEVVVSWSRDGYQSGSETLTMDGNLSYEIEWVRLYTLTIATLPSGAAVSLVYNGSIIDGFSSGTFPEGAEVTYVVKLDGYSTATDTITITSDIYIYVTLSSNSTGLEDIVSLLSETLASLTTVLASSATSIEVLGDATEVELAITATSGLGWTLSTSEDWITIDGAAAVSGTGSATVTVAISANASTVAREGTILLSADEAEVDEQTITVSQEAGYVYAGSYTLNIIGGTYTIIGDEEVSV